MKYKVKEIKRLNWNGDYVALYEVSSKERTTYKVVADIGPIVKTSAVVLSVDAEIIYQEALNEIRDKHSKKDRWIKEYEYKDDKVTLWEMADGTDKITGVIGGEKILVTKFVLEKTGMLAQDVYESLENKIELRNREVKEEWLKVFELNGDSVILYRRDDTKAVTYRIVSVVGGHTHSGDYVTSREGAIYAYDAIIDVIRERH